MVHQLRSANFVVDDPSPTGIVERFVSHESCVTPARWCIPRRKLILLDLAQLAVWSYESFARRDLLVDEEKLRVQAMPREAALTGRSILSVSDCWRVPQGRSIQNSRVAPALLHVSRAELLAHHEVCAAGK